MTVTEDEYELPLGVYDSVKEMAFKQGVKEMRIYKAIWRYEHGQVKQVHTISQGNTHKTV